MCSIHQKSYVPQQDCLQPSSIRVYPLGVAPRRIQPQSCITRQGQGRCRVFHCSSSALEENKNLVFEAGNYKVLSSKHLLKTINQAPDREWYNTWIPSSSSSLVLRLSFHSRVFWKWRYTGSAATWLLQ